MKKRPGAFLLSALMCLSLVACGTPQPAEEEAPAEEEVVEEPAVEEERYPEIADALDAGDYDGAIAAITEMKTEAMAQEAGDINDDLVTVEITPENFDEYFDVYTVPVNNAFGEFEYSCWYLRSRKYDEGLILYGLDDADYCDTISVEFVIRSTVDSGYEQLAEPIIDELGSMLDSGGVLELSWDPSVAFSLESISRMTGSKLTFVRSEYVESIELEERDKPDMSSTETITLKNGETFTYYYPRGGYPY